MRIIAGQYRGHPLRALGSLKLRPTSDRLRETLFDVLTAGNPAALDETAWLDLFAGTGAVGLEALSRGARMVYFVESSRSAVGLLRKNLAALGISEGYELQQREAEPALRLLDSQAVACDYIFLDPPYNAAAAYQNVLGFLSQSRLLSPATAVIAEHSSRVDPGAAFGSLQRYRRLDQGDAALSFFRLA